MTKTIKLYKITLWGDDYRIWQVSFYLLASKGKEILTSILAANLEDEIDPPGCIERITVSKGGKRHLAAINYTRMLCADFDYSQRIVGEVIDRMNKLDTVKDYEGLNKKYNDFQCFVEWMRWNPAPSEPYNKYARPKLIGLSEDSGNDLIQ